MAKCFWGAWKAFGQPFRKAHKGSQTQQFHDPCSAKCLHRTLHPTAPARRRPFPSPRVSVARLQLQGHENESSHVQTV